MISKYRILFVATLILAAAAAFLSLRLPTQPDSAAQGKQPVISSEQQTGPGSARTRYFGDATAVDNDFFYKSLVTVYRDIYVPQETASSRFVPAQSQGSKTNKTGARPQTGPPETAKRGTIFSLLQKSSVDTRIDQTTQQRSITPDVARMVGPFSQDKDLRDLPYIPVTKEDEKEVRLMRHPPGEIVSNAPVSGIPTAKQDPPVTESAPSIAPSMPSPTNTFPGMTSNLGCGGCLPPDTDGDVGPNYYMQSVNSSIRIHAKDGTVLAGPITYNSFFSAMGTSTPCGSNANQGDGVVFYDHIADRWIVSDFAFPAFPGTAFYQCVGVSKTSNPVSGGYWLYAIQIDPANNNFLGDYPKFGMWPDAYYMSVNEFSNGTTFNGVRVFALDRNSMINGGAANTIAFSVLPADLGDQYSFVPASFRTGNPPPVGQPEWVLSVNSSAVAGTVETQVFVRRFHVDFATPANSTFGVGATHAPDGIITVSGFVDAFTTTTDIVPNGTATSTQFLDTLGDKLMYPLIYQNLGGVESIWADQTVNNNQGGTGPTAVRWYQFNMTANTIPATPTQQQTFNNGTDGLWRWMPSINVDRQGNMAIGYSTSSTAVDPSIRYAGRLASDPLNNLGQGEAIMTPGTGHQTTTLDRWGDYSTMFVDPSDSCTFYHTNEFYSATSSASWNTRVGSFRFPGCVSSPLPTPTPTATPTPVPTPTPPVSAGPVTVTATIGTLGPTDYATVKAAFDAINAGTHQGAINIFILGDTAEGASAVLNASGTGSASYTSIFMTPTGTRTVAGSLAAAPLIDLNGADVVTIDGKNSGGNSLTFSNTDTGVTAGTSTLRFINGATNDTVKNCTILGSSTVPVGTAGGAVLFSTTTGTGNNNNTISGNNIGPAGANLPVKAISAVGTTTNNSTVNTANVIDNNNIFDFFGTGVASVTGIDIRTGNINWMISNNRIYQTATRTFTTSVGLRYSGITLSGSASDFHTISGNTIGFGAANGTGTTTITGTGSGAQNEVRGIDLQAASAGTATSVQGNTISGINQTSARLTVTTGLSAFAGIQVSTLAGGSATGVFDIGTITGNTIGSLDGSSTIVINASSVTASTTPIFGILAQSGSSDNVANNKIGAITIQGTGTVTGFRGIFAGSTAATTHTISNNIIGGPTAAGGITDTQVGSYAMYGIQTATAAATISRNVIRNITGNSNGASLIIGSGIIVTSTSTTNINTISKNLIYALSNNSGASFNAIYGISCNFPATANIVEKNFVHSLMMTSSISTGQLVGIISSAAAATGTATYRNNFVRLGVDATGTSITNGFFIAGLWDGTGTSNYFFNSVYVGGSGVVSSSNTFAFFSQITTNVRFYEDNIFWNARSNASGIGKNYAISVAGTLPNPAGLTSNFNDLYATGTGSFVGLFNAIDQPAITDWRTATGQDANSISADPMFVNANGTALANPGDGDTAAASPDSPAAVVDLHISAGSPVIGAGTPIPSITDDRDGGLRSLTTPAMGGDEFNAPTAASVTVSGRVLTPDGRGLRNAKVVITDANGVARTVTTSSFGFFQFDEVAAGESYVIGVLSKQYRFASQLIQVDDTLADITFIGQE